MARGRARSRWLRVALPLAAAALVIGLGRPRHGGDATAPSVTPAPAAPRRPIASRAPSVGLAGGAGAGVRDGGADLADVARVPHDSRSRCPFRRPAQDGAQAARARRGSGDLRGRHGCDAHLARRHCADRAHAHSSGAFLYPGWWCRWCCSTWRWRHRCSAPSTSTCRPRSAAPGHRRVARASRRLRDGPGRRPDRGAVHRAVAALSLLAFVA